MASSLFLRPTIYLIILALLICSLCYPREGSADKVTAFNIKIDIDEQTPFGLPDWWMTNIPTISFGNTNLVISQFVDGNPTGVTQKIPVTITDKGKEVVDSEHISWLVEFVVEFPGVFHNKAAEIDITGFKDTETQEATLIDKLIQFDETMWTHYGTLPQEPETKAKFRADDVGKASSSFTLNFSQTIPEPATVLLLGAGFVVVVLLEHLFRPHDEP